MERLSCAQLIQHAYFEQSRVCENYEQILEEHNRRMRAEKHKMNRQKNQRARVSQVCFMLRTMLSVLTTVLYLLKASYTKVT